MLVALTASSLYSVHVPLVSNVKNTHNSCSLHIRAQAIALVTEWTVYCSSNPFLSLFTRRYLLLSSSSPIKKKRKNVYYEILAEYTLVMGRKR